MKEKKFLTIQSLQQAIQGEQTAISKYEEYRRVALEEGLPNIAYLFKALIQAEKIHRNNHKNALSYASENLNSDMEIPEFISKISEYPVKKTSDNLRLSIEGETYEYKEMYPGFIKKIRRSDKSEAAKVARLSMEWAREVEKTHAEVLEMALRDLESGKDFQVDTIYVCSFCGNLVLNELPEFCPVCRHDKQFYHAVERN